MRTLTAPPGLCGFRRELDGQPPSISGFMRRYSGRECNTPRRIGAPRAASLEQESRMKNPHPHSIMFERVSLADAKRIHDRASANEAKPDWLQRRSANNNVDPLHPDTAKWIRGLPADIRPDELARRYARIANRIYSLWHQPSRCTDYLDELLIVRRASRQGFPREVAKDIAKLTAHYARLNRFSSMDRPLMRAS
jgi:hypothetical protein